MMGRGCVVAMWCVGALGCTEARTDNVRADSALARAVAARRTPAITLPDRPVTSIGRCAVEIGPRTPDPRPRVLAEFQARNGAAWRIEPSDFNTSLGLLRHVMEATDGDIKAPIVSLTDDEAVKLAVDFLAANYDLFGLSASDLGRVRINPGRQQDVGMMITRTVEFDGDSPQPGYEQFPTLARTWRAQFLVGRSGKLRAVLVAAQDLLPPLRLCTKPRLAANDARLTRDVLGVHLTYSTITGAQEDAGQVSASDIQSSTPTIHREYNRQRDSVVLRLAYLIVVRRGGLSWSFIVDADTGDRISMHPNFVS